MKTDARSYNLQIFILATLCALALAFAYPASAHNTGTMDDDHDDDAMMEDDHDHDAAMTTTAAATISAEHTAQLQQLLTLMTQLLTLLEQQKSMIDTDHTDMHEDH